MLSWSMGKWHLQKEVFVLLRRKMRPRVTARLGQSCAALPRRWGVLRLWLPPAFVSEEMLQVLILLREALITVWVRWIKGFQQAPPVFLPQCLQSLEKTPS